MNKISRINRFKLDAEVADFDLQFHFVLLELSGSDSRLLRLVLELGDASCHLATTTDTSRHIHSYDWQLWLLQTARGHMIRQI